MKKKKVIKITLTVLLVLVGLAVLVAGFFAIRGAIMWNNAKDELPVAQAAKQFRADADYIKFDDLPQFYVDAVISVEDRRFFEHSGISVKSIIRAVLYDLLAGSFEQGGSTITQQLAKNVWFDQEKRLERKFAEVFAAFSIENELSKNEIFELYVNTIYFGSGYYGIGEAARGYFGKEAAELTDYECAILAGIPNAPSAYDLNVAPELAYERMEKVLQAMQDNGKLTEDRVQEVLAQSESDAVGV